tara:strand:+ start:677 stop:898 length:222 start_codon:yes stop_codon:yes gene_type:complete
MIKTFLHFFGWFALSALVWVDSVYAYLDPGTGSTILQVLLAALAGGAYLIRLYWKKITGLFSRKKNKWPNPGK